MINLSDEDAKLCTLAKAALARINAPSGAAVRDELGRTYASANVDIPTLRISAIDIVVAQAVASGATGLEAAVILGAPADVNLAAAREIGGPELPIYLGDPDGTVHTVLP
jgi:hypothetical protein